MTAKFIIPLIVLLPALLPAADHAMTPEERQKTIQLLKDSRQETLSLVESLSDEQWKWKPAPNRWSVAEVTEHIMLAEGSLFSKVQEALANPANPEWETKTKGKTELLLRVMAPRMGKAEAPESIQPASKLSRAEIMRRLADGRAATIKFTEETQASFHDHTAEHAFQFFNTLNAYQWLIYIPLHNQRHDKQIQEVIAAEGFPKK